MAPDTDTQYPVHLGVWTNWSRGLILGRTLTLNVEDANLLIAFTGFFIAFVANRAWRIICFVFHRAHSTTKPQDAGYHQLQATLRNVSSAEDGFHLLLLLLWVWRQSRTWFRPLPVLIVAAVSVIGFTVAGGFSSRISTAMGHEVLINSVDCGYPMGTLGADIEAYYAYIANNARNIDTASNYAEACYSGDSAGLTDCNRFVTQQLTDNIIVDTNAECPFGDNICRNTSANLRLDTGYLDSHNHLGINAPAEERIIWRNVLHCAPIVTQGYTSQVSTSQGNMTRYHYGTTYHDSVPINYTFEALDIETQYREYLQTSKSSYFQLEVFDIIVSDGELRSMSADIDPIPSLFRSDAYTYIMFLSGNGVKFTDYVSDDWYRLSPVPRNTSLTGGNNGTSQTSSLPIYVPEEPASPMACTNQYQFCRPGFPEKTCTPLLGLYDAVHAALPLFNTTDDEYAYDMGNSTLANRVIYFMSSLWYAPVSVYDMIQHLGPKALESQKTLVMGLQGPIAQNQWQTDVMNWWNYSLAATQTAFINTASGPDDAESIKYRHSYNGSAFQPICDNQKIQSTAYASLSVLGLAITFAGGFAIILTSYVLQPIFKFLFVSIAVLVTYLNVSKTVSTGYEPHKHLEWTTNATYQLQRLAHEEIGAGTWCHGTNTFPITKPNELVAALDITNSRHPTLRQPLYADKDKDKGRHSGDTQSTNVCYDTLRADVDVSKEV
ncbi:hypothetical protein GGR57DRAFT_512248 [Xylariaceae sp. FL1272]|nr:hypothetical protein GGR57DRAFT_512248 [Xylariaceae sp. FL1272]